MEVDGSLGEGGGQVVRTSLALSAVTGTPVRVANVRANRPQPGLKAQHAAVALAFAEVTGGKVEGAEVGSTTLAFEPGALRGGELRVDIGTAGSIPLFLQALMPALARSDASWRVQVGGGTDGKWAPTFDHFARVHVHALERIGWRPRVKLVRRGFWPRGGGSAILECGPWQPRGFDVARSGAAWRVGGRIVLANLRDDVATRAKNAALGVLRDAGMAADVDVSSMPALDPGVAVTLWADDGACRLGADALGEKGLPSEELGALAARRLLAEVQGLGSVDAHAADMLLPYAALAASEGHACTFAVREASSHLRTNALVAERFLPVRVALQGEAPVEVRVSPVSGSGGGPRDGGGG